MNAIVTLKQISKIYGEGDNAVNALVGADLEIRPGEVHGLIGPNGSGKTTTLNVISGYYAPQRGAIDAALAEDAAGAVLAYRDARTSQRLAGSGSARAASAHSGS